MDASNVSFGKAKATGAVFIAPAGTTLPTNATTALSSDFINLGYISEDGLVNSVETDTEDIKAWGGDTVLVGQTSFKETFTVNLLETNANALKAYYGADNVTVDEDTGAITVKQTATVLPEQVVVFEVVMTGNRVKRIVLPKGQIVDRSGEISYTDGAAITYPAVFQAYPDATGTTHKEFIATISTSA